MARSDGRLGYTDAWGDDAAPLNTSAANTTTTSAQIETASSVTDSVHASGDAIKCIAFYPTIPTRYVDIIFSSFFIYQLIPPFGK